MTAVTMPQVLTELRQIDHQLRGVGCAPALEPGRAELERRQEELAEVALQLVPPACPPDCDGLHRDEVLDGSAGWWFHVAYFGPGHEIQVAVCQNFDTDDDPADPATVTLAGRVEDDTPDYAAQIGSALLDAAACAQRWRLG